MKNKKTMYKSYLNRADLPRGLRNNNPGNLVKTSIPWDGKIPLANNKDPRFEQFIELRYGIRAKMRDLITDINKGNNTVTGLIKEFAPDFENNTAAYIATVVKMTGLSAFSRIDLTEETLIALCKAISFVENGASFTKYVTDDDYKDAIAILGIKLPKKKAL
jgi:hypothetical protein